MTWNGRTLSQSTQPRLPQLSNSSQHLCVAHGHGSHFIGTIGSHGTLQGSSMLTSACWACHAHAVCRCLGKVLEADGS